MAVQPMRGHTSESRLVKAYGPPIVTLPVEFNASRRAMARLTSRGIVTEDEAAGVQRAPPP